MTETDPLAPAQEAWARVLDELRLQLCRATFDTWLRGTRVVACGEGGLRVALRHEHALKWIEARLRSVVERTVERVVGPGTAVEFVVEGTLAQVPAADDTAASKEEKGARSRAGGACTLAWSDFYIKFKVAFRKRALRALKGAKLAVFLCLALHVDWDGVAEPGIEAIMRETGYSRGVVCSALGELETLGLVSKLTRIRQADRYLVRGYAWFGGHPAPALWEEVEPGVR